MDVIAPLNQSLIGRYDVEREIGAGGMARVYLARDVRHDRRVALKVLHPDLAAALGAERFLAEIRTTANLQHPHILPLHDSGEAGGHLFYVMPFVQGETLRDRLTRESLLPIDDALRIAREVAGALDYAHRQGIVHRDVKPENILLHDGSALVADFGIALAVSAAGTNRMTQTGLSLGTPQYMSPEQAMGEKSVDARADIYALGAVLYEMLCGEPPFSGASVQAIVAKVLTERPTPPSTVRDTVPPTVEAAVLRALAKLPADRFATAKSFADALVPGTATSASPSSEPRSFAARGARRRWIALTLAAVAGALAAGILVGMTIKGRSTSPATTERYVLTDDPLLDIGLGASMTYMGSPLAIASNGSRIAYVASDSAGTRVEVRDLDRLDARQIAGTSGARSVAISPDGSTIAFTRDAQLWVTEVRAGSPRVIVRRGASGPYWGDDGRIYFSAPPFGSNGVGGIFRIAADGARIDTLITRPNRVFLDPVPSPDGRAVLVRDREEPGIGWLAVGGDSVRHLMDGDMARFVDEGHIVVRTPAGTLTVATIDGDRGVVQGNPVALTDGVSAESALAASRFDIARNGSLVYVAGGGTQTELAWVGRDGSIIAMIDSSMGTAATGVYPAISPDGRRVAYSSSGIHVYDLAQRTSLQLTGGNAGVAGNYPAWTPDGRSISYFGPSGGTGADSLRVLYLKPADGSAPARVIARVDRNIDESAWSPDGKWVLFRTFSNQRGAGDILGLRFGVDSAPTPLLATEAGELQPTISPEGRWLAYVTDKSGRPEVVVVPFPNVQAALWSISSDGGSEPKWSRSGRELFYRNARGDMVSVPIVPGSSFVFGAPKRLFSATQFRAYSGHAQYDVSSDGQRFLMGAPARTRAKPRLVLVKNFRVTESR